MENLDREKILNILKDDAHYYGEFGKQFLSNSDISSLLSDPKSFKKDQDPNINFFMGGAFHTLVLEPEKFEANYPAVDASTRTTRKYKTAAEEAGKMLLLEKDVPYLKELRDVLLSNDLLNDMIAVGNVEYEVPAFGEIYGEYWKGKADVINHDEKLIIDIKTTSDISKFFLSARKYNYDSQAYIYREFFGYDFAFAVIDKKTQQLGYYDCSENFYESGKEKVIAAVHAYRMYHKDQEFDWSNYIIQETL